MSEEVSYFDGRLGITKTPTRCKECGSDGIFMAEVMYKNPKARLCRICSTQALEDFIVWLAQSGKM